MTTQVQVKLEEKNELCKFYNFAYLKSSEKIGHNVKAHAHVSHESILKSYLNFS